MLHYIPHTCYCVEVGERWKRTLYIQPPPPSLVRAQPHIFTALRWCVGGHLATVVLSSSTPLAQAQPHASTSLTPWLALVTVWWVPPWVLLTLPRCVGLCVQVMVRG